MILLLLCTRSLPCLHRATSVLGCLQVLQHLVPELLISEPTSSLFRPLCHICTVCIVSVLQLQSHDPNNAHSDLMHTFCDELLATVALCVQSVRSQLVAAPAGFAATSFGLLHATFSAIKGSASWPRAPSQGSSDSGHLICEVDFSAACGSSLLGCLLQVLHHSMLLYGDVMQPHMRTVAQLLPLCVQLCPVQQLPVLLSSLTLLLRNHASLHSLLAPSMPVLLHVCMLAMRDVDGTVLGYTGEQPAPAHAVSHVCAACDCMHALLSLGAHACHALPPHWQLVQAAAAALQQQHESPSVRSLFHRVLLRCDSAAQARSHVAALPGAALQALEAHCTPLQLVPHRIQSLKKRDQNLKVRVAVCGAVQVVA